MRTPSCSSTVTSTLFLLAALSISACAADEPENPAPDLQRQADDMRAEGRLQEAIALYEQAVEADPELAPAFLGLAISHSSLGNDAEAERFYLVAEAKDPSDVQTKLNLAGFYYRGRNYERALQVLQKASDVAPGGDEAQIIAGLYSRVETAQVRANMRRGLLDTLAENPGDEEAAARLADVYAKEAADLLQAGNADASLAVLREGLGATPEIMQAELRYVGAQAYSVQGDSASALEWLNAAIELNDDAPSYHLARAGFHIEQKEYDEALDELDRVIELDPASEEAEFARIRRTDVARFQEVPEGEVEAYLEQRRKKVSPAKKKNEGGVRPGRPQGD